jgi:hypothetical protein
MKFGCYLFGHSYKSNEGISYFKYSCVRCEHQSNYPGMEKWENTFWDSEYWGAIKIIFWIIFGILVFGISGLDAWQIILNLDIFRLQNILEL